MIVYRFITRRGAFMLIPDERGWMVWFGDDCIDGPYASPQTAAQEIACREQSPSYSRREREDEGSSKPQRIGAGKYKEVPQSIIALERESNRPVVAADVCCATCGPSWQPSARHRRGISAWKFDSINHSSGPVFVGWRHAALPGRRHRYRQK
ncbi:hypothetical protein [Azonexus sp.]|uniref:hypothetical protein n=1 Tax=Azonexus sp. TaxID=1872668 RepID=UPI0039E237B8